MEEELFYKYFSNESTYAFQNLENEKISFTSLETLNDPFEGVGAYLYHTTDEEKAYFNSINCNLPELACERLSEDTKQLANFKYRVFCCTKDFDNPLMWSYYANSHQGFCVGHKKNDIIDVSDKFDHVVYSDEMYLIGERKQDTLTFSDNFSTNLLFHKSKDWQIEKEYRALYEIKSEDVSPLTFEKYFSEHHNKDKICYVNRHILGTALPAICSSKYILKSCKPAVIYLGLRTPTDIKNKLLQIASKKAIPVFQMTQEQNRYHFSCAQITTSV